MSVSTVSANFRTQALSHSSLSGTFPAQELAADMVRAGVKAKVTCVDPRHLDRSYAGRGFDAAFISALPSSVDPCGENGEFHTFVHDAPVFSRPIDIQTGEIVERDGFIFADVL